MALAAPSVGLSRARTDDKPRGEWSSLRLSRGAKEEDKCQGGKPKVNDKDDTLKVVQVTDRERVRSRDRFKAQETKIEVRVDTVYVEKRDSVYVQNTDGFGGLTTGLTNRTDKRASPLSYLKWICWILIGLMGLIITVKVCLRR